MENNAHSIFRLRYDRREVCFPETSRDSKRRKRPFNASVPQPIDRLSQSQDVCRSITHPLFRSLLVRPDAKMSVRGNRRE